MIMPNPLKASPLGFIPVAALCSVLAATSAKAEEVPSAGPQVYVEQSVNLVQNSAQKTYLQQQTGNYPEQLPTQQDDWKISIGAGVMFKPAFVGSKDYQAVALPEIKVEYKDRLFISPMEAGYSVINRDGWRVGPMIKFEMGRKENDDNPFRIAGEKTNALRGLGTVDATLGLGGFVEYKNKPFSYKLELHQGVGGHKGFVGKIGLNYMDFTKQLGKPLMYAFGPRVIFADANYNNAYFGITQTQSANSGLARYKADFGLVSYGIGGFAAMSVSKSVSVGVIAGYDRLGSEAADSPLIKERGDKNQFMGGVRISYKFGW